MPCVHALDEARAALKTGARELISPPFAAYHAGVNYYRHLLDQLQQEFVGTDFRFTLCCGDNPAIAHDALRMGFTSIRCDCPEAQFAELCAIADRYNAHVQRA